MAIAVQVPRQFPTQLFHTQQRQTADFVLTLMLTQILSVVVVVISIPITVYYIMDILKKMPSAERYYWVFLFKEFLVHLL